MGAGGASAAELGQEYKDEDDKYAFKVPADWEMATGAAPANSQSTRRVVAFYPAGSPEINGACRPSSHAGMSRRMTCYTPPHSPGRLFLLLRATSERRNTQKEIRH